MNAVEIVQRGNKAYNAHDADALAALLLVSQRPQRVFSLLAPRTQAKFSAALLYEPQTWCTRGSAG